MHGVWDLPTGKMLAQWSFEVAPEEKESAFTTLRRAFAISPDGKLLAEAGSGLVRLYRLP